MFWGHIWLQVISEVRCVAISIVQGDHQRLIKEDVPRAFNTVCINMGFIYDIHFQDGFICKAELVLLSDYLNSVWKLVSAELLGIVNINFLPIIIKMECPGTTNRCGAFRTANWQISRGYSQDICKLKHVLYNILLI